jgi:Flp pilus assembly pilin Flp
LAKLEFAARKTPRENESGSIGMLRIQRLLKRVGADEKGAAMAEYVVLLGVIVGALVLVVTNFAGLLQAKFASVCAALGGSC